VTIQKQRDSRAVWFPAHSVSPTQREPPPRSPHQSRALRGSAVPGVEVFCQESFECCCAAGFRKLILSSLGTFQTREENELLYWRASKQMSVRVDARGTHHAGKRLEGSAGQLPKSYSQVAALHCCEGSKQLKGLTVYTEEKNKGTRTSQGFQNYHKHYKTRNIFVFFLARYSWHHLHTYV